MNKRKQRGRVQVWTLVFIILWAMMPWPLISFVDAGEKPETPNHSVTELEKGQGRGDSTPRAEIESESTSNPESSPPAEKSTDERGVGIRQHRIQAEMDTYVQEKYPDYNYPHSPELRTGHATQVGKTRSYIQFGSELPDLEGGLLIRAKFKAYKYYEYPNHAVDTTIQIHPVGWNPADIDWNKQPEIGDSYADRDFPAGAAEGWYDWDITHLVQDWYDHPDDPAGLVMQASNEEIDGSYRKFYTGVDRDGKYTPRLELTYSPKPAPPTGTRVDNGSAIHLTWNRVPGAKGYKVLISKGEGYESVDVGNRTHWSAQGKKGDSQFRVVAYNAYGETAPSDSYRPSIPGQIPPSQPGKPVCSREIKGRFTFTWRASEVDKYRVYMGTAPGQADLANGAEVTTNQYTHPEALDPRRIYYLAVVAVNGAGDVSPPSESGRGGGWLVWHWKLLGISPPSPFQEKPIKRKKSRYS